MTETEPSSSLVRATSQELMLSRLPAMASRAVDIATKVPSLSLRAASSLTAKAVDVLEPADPELQNKFRPLAQGVAFVGPLEPSRSETEQHDHAASIARALRFGRVATIGRTLFVGVFALGSEQEEPSAEARKTAELLPERIQRETGAISTYVDLDPPACLPPSACKRNPIPAYDAIYQRTSEFRGMVTSLARRDVPLEVISTVFITDERPCDIFEGFEPEDLRDGGIVVFGRTGKNSKYYEWRPVTRAREAADPTDNRSGRFTRAQTDQEPAAPAHMDRTEPAPVA